MDSGEKAMNSIDSMIASIKSNKTLCEEKQYISAHLKEIPCSNTLTAYEPKKEWFNVDSKLHGIMHEARVLVLVELLGQISYAEQKVDIESLRYAAITHDVKRINDWYDFQHGERAAEWITERKPIPHQYITTTAHIVQWHVTQDIAIPHMTPELRLFKDADGLDRWRIGDLNSNYLRTFHAVNMQETARGLFLLSAALKEQNVDDFNAVLEAARLLDITR